MKLKGNIIEPFCIVFIVFVIGIFTVPILSSIWDFSKDTEIIIRRGFWVLATGGGLCHIIILLKKLLRNGIADKIMFAFLFFFFLAAMLFPFVGKWFFIV